jgi:hypothetical protein
MSTKVTIKHRARAATSPGFHLYDDVLDEFGKSNDEISTPVYLRLDGVAVQLETLTDGRASITVTLPREMARELGLLIPTGAAQGCERA